MHLALPSIAHRTYGAPADVYLHYGFEQLGTASNATIEIALNLSWFNKTATRLGEAMWLSLDIHPMVWR